MTPQSHEKRVLSMTVIGEVYKSRDNCGKPCFAVDTEYTLHDGSIYKSRVTSATKKRLSERIESKQRSISQGSITIDKGWEVCRFTIG